MSPMQSAAPVPSLLLRIALTTFVLVATAACGGESGSPTIPPPPPPGGPVAITRLLDSIRVVYDVPALGAAIVTTDGVWAIDVRGRRRYGGTTPVTVNDKFHLGSNLKAMTSAMIGRLVDAGMLEWETTLAEALPDLAPAMGTAYRDATIADLLSHTSGLPRDPFSGVLTASTATEQRLQAAQWGFAQPATPRGAYSYSNLGYMVAGLIAERAAGQPFETLIVERLFTPLGMTSVGFGAMGTPGTEDQPWQHYIDGGTRREVAPGPNADNPLAYGPAGRAHMSLGDWAKFMVAVLKAEQGDVSVWSAATADMLTTSRVSSGGADGYAMGWATTTRSWAPGGRVLNHDGTNTLSYSVTWAAANAGFAVLVVTNQGGATASQAADAAAGRLLGLYLNGK
jgi:CubicO group peptidase (beta-lactamase class C family)